MYTNHHYVHSRSFTYAKIQIYILPSRPVCSSRFTNSKHYHRQHTQDCLLPPTNSIYNATIIHDNHRTVGYGLAEGLRGQLPQPHPSPHIPILAVMLSIFVRFATDSITAKPYILRKILYKCICSEILCIVT